MKQKPISKRKRNSTKSILRLPDLEHAKAAVLNSLNSTDAKRGYRHAIDEFVDWYCSEPRLAFNRIVVLRYLWLPKTPSELKMQWFRAFVRSWWYHDELSFCCPFRFGHLQFSIPCRPAGGDPRASSSTRGFPEECTAAFAPPAVRPAFVGLAVTMVARLAPESTHRSPRYSDRLAP